MELAVETRTNQLEQALAHRQTFISTMSHEVRSFSRFESGVFLAEPVTSCLTAANTVIRCGRTV
jgi:hypothetical protein